MIRVKFVLDHCKKLIAFIDASNKNDALIKLFDFCGGKDRVKIKSIKNIYSLENKIVLR